MARKASPKKTAKPGRQTERLAAILAAAETVFLEKGYDGGSLDDVARVAGASKATIYAHFGSKFGLFEAILSARIAQVQQPLKAGEAVHAPARDVLTQFGRGFLRTLLAPVPLKFYRLIISQGIHFPELSRTWFHNGPRTAITALGAFFKHRTAHGELDVPDPDTAAEFFLMSLRGTLQMQALVGLIEPPFDDAINAKVAAAVDMIMRAYGPQKGIKP
jgi:TetR/AcrR family transcriptional repressor of mexJK operon